MAASADPNEDGRAPTAWLAALGALSLAVYLAANYLLPQAPRFMDEPAAGLAPAWAPWRAVLALPDPGPAAALAIAAATMLLPSAAYLAALRLAWRAPASRAALGVVVGFALLFWLSSALTLPQNSHDLFAYILFGRVAGIYGANPYSVTPATFPGDPFLPYGEVGWTLSTTPYGPVWTYFSAGLLRLAGNDPTAAILSLRLALLALNLGSLGLIAGILRRLRPEHVLAGVLLYAWNPVVALMGQDHNEPLMVFCLLLGVYAGARGREWLGLLGLALSVLAKFVTGPLLALYVVFMAREARARRLLLIVGVAAVVAGAWLLSIDPGPLRALARTPTPQPSGGIQPRYLAAAAATLLALAVAAWHLWRRRSWEALLAGWGLVTYVFMLIFPSGTYAWYQITLAGVLSLVRSVPLVVLGAALFVWAIISNQLGTVVSAFAPVPGWLFPLLRWGTPLAVLALLAAWRFARRNSEHP